MRILCRIEELEGMSDLCMYELEDIDWDVFGQSDDHIVPRASEAHANEDSCKSDSCKKPRLEVKAVSSNAAKYINQGKEQRDFSSPINRNNTMLEKDSWSCTPDCAFPASCDGESTKEVTSLGSDNTRISSNCGKTSNIDAIHSEFCANDPVLDDKCVAADSDSYSYSLSHLSQTNNDLSFFANNRENKDSSDLLYYSWPDIGNFEDVDRMFRSCDSTFGLGSVGDEEDLGWFSSSEALEGSDNVLKPDFKFSCPGSNALKHVSECHESLNMNNASRSINDSGLKGDSITYNDSSQPSADDDSSTFVGYSSLVNGSDNISGNKDTFIQKEQGVLNGGAQFKISSIQTKNDNSGMINQHKKQVKHHKYVEGKRKDRYLGNGSSFHFSNIQTDDEKLPCGDATSQVLPSGSIQQQNNSSDSDSFHYLQTKISFTHTDYVCHPDHTIKSESNGLTSLSPRESSFASNQMESMHSVCDPSFHMTPFMRNDCQEKLNGQQVQQSFSEDHKRVDLVVQTSICDPVQKNVLHPGSEFDNHGDIEGISIGIPTELGSANAQENTSISSVVDEISLESTSFRQLQLVMEKLDLRTKLCIRDSLYRLARSAEQRHNHTHLNTGSVYDSRTNGALMVEGTNKCSGFMDMETDTNPIDRSIAHLLFHRPPDSSVTPTDDHDSLPHKSHGMIRGSVTSPAAAGEKLICLEKSASETDERIADH